MSPFNFTGDCFPLSCRRFLTLPHQNTVRHCSSLVSPNPESVHIITWREGLGRGQFPKGWTLAESDFGKESERALSLFIISVAGQPCKLIRAKAPVKLEILAQGEGAVPSPLGVFLLRASTFAWIVARPFPFHHLQRQNRHFPCHSHLRLIGL